MGKEVQAPKKVEKKNGKNIKTINLGNKELLEDLLKSSKIIQRWLLFLSILGILALVLLVSTVVYSIIYKIPIIGDYNIGSLFLYSTNFIS